MRNWLFAIRKIANHLNAPLFDKSKIIAEFSDDKEKEAQQRAINGELLSMANGRFAINNEWRFAINGEKMIQGRVT